MSLKSMTGFARTDGVHDGVRWHWEVRSVNGRGLDIKLRLPPGLDQLEPKLREAAQKRLTRGNVNASLNLSRETRAAVIKLNEAALMQVVAAADRARELTGGERPSIDSLLAIRGVLEVAEADDALDEALGTAIIASFDVAVAKLAEVRSGEGRRLADVIAGQLGQIEQLTAAAAASPSRTPEAIGKRLAEQVQRLVDAGTGPSADRLYQEAVLLATKADIEEEVKRLGVHIAAARQMLGNGEPVGRQFDFLAQEFNREANTLCSKANDPEITQIGLQLKTVIDQMREQVQNIE